MSNIDPSKPTEGLATTQSVRDNFQAAADEIDANAAAAAAAQAKADNSVQLTGAQSVAGQKIFTDQPLSSAVQGTSAAAMTRKDYVDQAIADALSTLVFPIGSMLMGFNPNGVWPGAWEQLPEGTFLMNTIGGADPAGGSNDAVTIAHIHTATQPTHFHTATQGTHSHPAAGAHTHPILAGSNDGNGIFVDNVTSGTDNGTKAESAGNHSHPATSAGTITVQAKSAGAITVASTGVAGTGLNRPKYVGVEVWQRIS